VNETTRDLDLIRTHLRAAIERDLQGRSPRSRVLHRRSFRIAMPTLAALAAVTVAIVLGLTLSAGSPSSASAAARRALAATAAAPSGTITTTVLHRGVTHTVSAVSWHGREIAFRPGIGPIPQIRLIRGGMYVQTSDGTWLHYAKASNVAPKPLGGLEQLAKDNIAGTTAQQILALATDVRKTSLLHGTTLYTGTIPNTSLNPAMVPGNDAITNMILGAQKRTDMMLGAGQNQGHAYGGHNNDLQLRMSISRDGLVRQVSVTFHQQSTGSPARHSTYTWRVTYRHLGSTPPIKAPTKSTTVPPGTLPPGTLPPNTQTHNSQAPSN
jgi:hypothetical protein